MESTDKPKRAAQSLGFDSVKDKKNTATLIRLTGSDTSATNCSFWHNKVDPVWGLTIKVNPKNINGTEDVVPEPNVPGGQSVVWKAQWYYKCNENDPDNEELGKLVPSKACAGFISEISGPGYVEIMNMYKNQRGIKKLFEKNK